MIEKTDLVRRNRCGNFAENLRPFNTPSFCFGNPGAAVISFKISIGNQTRTIQTLFPDDEFKELVAVLVLMAHGESVNHVIEFSEEMKTHLFRLENKRNGKLLITISYLPYLKAIHEFLGITPKPRIVFRQETTLDLLIRAFIHGADPMLAELKKLDRDSYSFKRRFPWKKYTLLKEIMEGKMM